MNKYLKVGKKAFIKGLESFGNNIDNFYEKRFNIKKLQKGWAFLVLAALFLIDAFISMFSLKWVASIIMIILCGLCLYKATRGY